MAAALATTAVMIRVAVRTGIADESDGAEIERCTVAHDAEGLVDAVARPREHQAYRRDAANVERKIVAGRNLQAERSIGRHGCGRDERRRLIDGYTIDAIGEGSLIDGAGEHLHRLRRGVACASKRGCSEQRGETKE